MIFDRIRSRPRLFFLGGVRCVQAEKAEVDTLKTHPEGEVRVTATR